MMKKLDFIMVLIAIILVIFFLSRGYSKTVGNVEDVDIGEGTVETR